MDPKSLDPQPLHASTARAGSVWVLAGVLVLVACAAPAAAGEARVGGALTAQDLYAKGHTTQNGTLSMFKAWDAEAARGPASVWLAFEAEAVHAEVFTTQGVDIVATNVFLPAGERTGWSDTNVQAELAGFTPRFHLQGFTRDGALTLHNAAGSDLSVQAVDAVMMDKEQIRAAGPGDQDAGEDAGWFQGVRLDSPHALVGVQSGGGTFEVHGDFMLELTGLNLTVTGDEGDHVLDTRRSSSPLVPEAPPGIVSEDHRKFARLELTGARLVFTMEGGDHLIQWAASALVSTTLDGQLVLHGVDGSFEGEGIKAGRLVVSDPYRLHIQPQAGHLDIAATPTDEDGVPLGPQPSAFFMPRGWLSASLWALAALALLAIIGSVGWIAVQRTRMPDMSQVEGALESGRYGRAARLAGRILNREPSAEDARVARSVALTRQGLPHQVVDEVVRHLERHRPSDGVLHYVLGLAYMELGQEQDARQAFRDAVQRTPALEHQVASCMQDGRTRDRSGSEVPAYA